MTRFVQCAFEGPWSVGTGTWAGFCSHDWVNGECANGLPNGDCFGVIQGYAMPAAPKIIMIRRPNLTYMGSHVSPNGGVEFLGNGDCTSYNWIAIYYICSG